jgi:hypothetical protein
VVVESRVRTVTLNFWEASRASRTGLPRGPEAFGVISLEFWAVLEMIEVEGDLGD